MSYTFVIKNFNDIQANFIGMKTNYAYW